MRGARNLFTALVLLTTYHFTTLPLFAAEVIFGAPTVEVSTSNWKNLPKYFVPTAGWETAISSGRTMYWDGSNWWVKIATDDPSAPIEGNDYNYRYVVQEDANFILEQTTVDHKVSLPLFASSETVRVVKVNDNFGRPSTPAFPNDVQGFRLDAQFDTATAAGVQITWTEPKFATRVGTSPISALTSTNIQNLSIRDLLLYQIWRSSVNVDANSSSASYVQVGNALSTEIQFLDSDILPGVTYYYVMRSRDAYEPPDFSAFSQPIKPTTVIRVNVILTVDVSKVSGGASAVFVTVRLPDRASNILTRAPLVSNGDGTWTISFLDAAITSGKKMQYRYARTFAQGDETEPDQPNTPSRDHEFMLDPNKPQMDTSTIPYVVRIRDRWGVPTYDESPKGLPKLFASVSISSGVTEPGIGTGDAISVGVDQTLDALLSPTDQPSAPGALVWYSVTSTGPFVAIPNPTLPDVKLYFGTSTESGSKLWDVSVATEPGYTVVYSTVNGAAVPAAPCRAFGEPVAKLFVKSANSSYKFQPVDVTGKVSGRASEALETGEEMPKWVDASTQAVQFTNTLQLKNGQKTGEIRMNWVAPPALNAMGPAHHYDVRYATFPINSMASLKSSKMMGRLEASMTGANETFATINLGDSAPGYHFALIPIYDDWSAATGAKVVIQFGRIGVAPKLLNVNAKLKEAAQRRIVKGALAPTALGRVNIPADGPASDLRANLEVPRSGLELTQAMAVIKNARETADDAAALARIEKANAEAKKSLRRITGSLAPMNQAGDSAADSSLVSFEVSDLAGKNYFDSDKITAKLPLKISLPIPQSWQDKNGNGIIDATENTDKPVRLADLRIYRLNTKGNFWELVNEGDHTVDLANRAVRAEVKHLSTFALFAPGGAAKDLKELVVYPNPFVPFDDKDENGIPWSAGDLRSGIAFDNLTDNSEIFIYTLAMDMVKRHKLTGADVEEKNGKWRWDARNDNGDFVASGLYIYMVKDDNAIGVNKKTGKLVIVR